MSDKNKKHIMSEPQEEFKDDRPASQRDESEQNATGYDEWSLKELMAEAKGREITDYENMDKEELINKLTENG